MKRHLWRAVKITVGGLLLGLGAVGFFLPVLPGIVFVLMGLSLLSTESTWARSCLDYLRERGGWARREPAEAE